MDDADGLGAVKGQRLYISAGERTLVVVEHGDGRYSIEEPGDTALRVTPLGNGRYLIEANDRHEIVHAVSAGGHTWVHRAGHVEVVEVSESGPRRGAADAAASLAAPMPASVVDVRVRTGDEVAAGDVLILVEAMKMELPIRAPKAGRVAAVHCRAGELVQPNVPLVTLE